MLHAAELLKHRFDNLLDLRRCQILFCRVSRAVHWRHPVTLRIAAIHEVLQLTPIENLHVVPRFGDVLRAFSKWLTSHMQLLLSVFFTSLALTTFPVKGPKRVPLAIVSSAQNTPNVLEPSNRVLPIAKPTTLHSVSCRYCAAKLGDFTARLWRLTPR